MPVPQNDTAAPPQQTLAGMVRAKYPGAYDDLDDATLEKNVLAKYPQYSDIPLSKPKFATPDPTKPDPTAAGLVKASGSKVATPYQMTNWFGPQPNLTQEQEDNLRKLLPQVPGTVKAIRRGALEAGGAAFGGEAGQLAKGLPWAMRTLAGASGAGFGAGAGTLAGGGSPKEALQNAAVNTATGAPVFGIAEGANDARKVLQNAAYKEFPKNVDVPEGQPQLTKGAARVSRAAGTMAGGGIGAALPVPGAGYAGGVAGFELGPSMMEKMLGTPELGSTRNPGPYSKLPWRVKPPVPEPSPLGSPDNPGWYAKLPARLPAPTPEPSPLGSPENPGWYAKLPARIKPTVAETPGAPLGSPENPGWHAKLPARMPTKLQPPKVKNSPFGDAVSSANPGGQGLQLPPLPQGNPTPFPTVQPRAQVTGSAAEPFEPLIYSSPEEAAANDFRMKNLQRQAKAAGTYHAAQGGVGRRTNLQQRIQKKIDDE